MLDFSAIAAAVVVAAFLALGLVGGGVKDTAARMFDRNPADFSAKFIRP